MNAVTQGIRCLLASKRMFKELCECNEHRRNGVSEVRVHAKNMVTIVNVI